MRAIYRPFIFAFESKDFPLGSGRRFFNRRSGGFFGILHWGGGKTNLEVAELHFLKVVPRFAGESFDAGFGIEGAFVDHFAGVILQLEGVIFVFPSEGQLALFVVDFEDTFRAEDPQWKSRINRDGGRTALAGQIGIAGVLRWLFMIGPVPRREELPRHSG